MRQVFARGQDEDQRGLTPGFLEGPQHQMLVRGRAPRHRGVLAGHVVHVDARSTTVTINMLVGLSHTHQCPSAPKIAAAGACGNAAHNFTMHDLLKQ